MKEAFEFFKNGGVVMIPIALGSLIATIIFMERLWSLRSSAIVPVALHKDIMALLEKGKFQKARDACLSSKTPMGRLIVAGIDVREETRKEIKERFEEVGRREVALMDRFIEALGTIASVEPLLGLLGTVTGMIGVFKKVVGTASEGAVDPAQLAGGIWQALITTAAGLSVAIVAFLGYRYLQSRSDRNAMRLEEISEDMLEMFGGHTPSVAKGTE